MELIYAKEYVVEFAGVDAVEGIEQCGVGADEFGGCGMVEKLAQLVFLRGIAAGGLTEIPVGCHFPVGEEAEFLQRRVFERATDILLRHRHNDFADALIGELVESHEHHSTTFAGCRRRFDEQILAVALVIDHSLHLAHA